METKKAPRGPGSGAPLTDEEMREWSEFMRSLGARPATGPWPSRLPEPILPRFYLLRKWVIWPVQLFIKRRQR